MNILSIDVGIKNLAFCILCINKDKSYTIGSWNVLDLCNTQTFTCTSLQKNGKCCTNNAKFKKNDSLYCKKHTKKSGFKIPKNELTLKKINKYTIKKLKEIIQKYEIPFTYTKQKYTLKKQMIDTIIEEVNIKYLENISKINCNAASFHMVDLGINLKKKFNDCLDYTNIHKVVIENQIGPLALRMKSLQGMIMQHFIENNITDITEVSSRNKLKEYLNGKKTTYSERKKISIIVTRDIIEKNKELNIWLENFSKSKKKDDLADCFLQGLWYIKNKI